MSLCCKPITDATRRWGYRYLRDYSGEMHHAGGIHFDKRCLGRRHRRHNINLSKTHFQLRWKPSQCVQVVGLRDADGTPQQAQRRFWRASNQSRINNRLANAFGTPRGVGYAANGKDCGYRCQLSSMANTPTLQRRRSR